MFTLRSNFLIAESGGSTQLISKPTFQHGLRYVSQPSLLRSTYIHHNAATSFPRHCNCLLCKTFPPPKLRKIYMHSFGWEYINMSPKEMVWCGFD